MHLQFKSNGNKNQYKSSINFFKTLKQITAQLVKLIAIPMLVVKLWKGVSLRKISERTNIANPVYNKIQYIFIFSQQI